MAPNPERLERANRRGATLMGCVAALVLMGSVSAQPNAASTVVGRLETIPSVASPHLGNERDILVLLPPGYDEGTRRYRVMYMNDGQNLFDEATSYAGEWRADETAQASAERGFPVILVGIPNMGEERLAEYAPFPGVEANMTARAEAYAAFVATTVKPLVDERYRTLADRDDTAIVGSSMGGLVSLYSAMRYPGVFGFAGALSPSLWWGSGKPVFAWADLRASPSVRVWLDMGTEEGWGQTQDVMRMATLLRDRGADVRLVIDEGAQHHESAWSKRFPAVLAWFLTGEADDPTITPERASERAAALDRARADGLATLAGARLAHGAPSGAQPTFRFDVAIDSVGYDAAGAPQYLRGAELRMLVDVAGRRVRIEVEHEGATMLVQQADPDTSWLWAADGTFLLMDPDAAMAVRRYALNTVLGLFARHDDVVAAVGPTTVAGLRGDGVMVVEDGAMTTYVFGADRTLIAERLEQPWADAAELRYLDVREVGGLRIPHRIEEFQHGTLTSVLTLSALEVDPALPDDAFDRP